MKKLITLLVITLHLVGQSNATNVSGAISSNTTWTSAGNPYVVTSSITVNSGVILTIQSGVTVQFNDGFGMTVLGTLDATGSIFTSSSASPTAGKWTSINIGTAANRGVVILTSCQLSYGQSIAIVRGSLTTNSTDISNFQNYGVILSGYATDSASANIAGGTFNNIGSVGIYNNINGKFSTNGTNFSNTPYGVYITTSPTGSSSMSGGLMSGMSQAAIYQSNNALLTLSGVSMNGNNARGLYLNNGNISLSACTITNTTTPIEYNNPSNLVIVGNSNTFSGNTNKYVYMNHSSLSTAMTLPSISLPYYFPNGYTIYAGGRLQLSDDNILKFSSSGINVYQGKLIANASVGKQIYFTSFKDDNLGGDANGDASATAPGLNNWSGIDFPDATIDTACILRRVTIKFADRGIEIATASPTIDSCTFSVNYHGIYAIDASYPIITGCTFGSSGMTPIALTFDADPVFTGNIFSFQDNQYDAIGLIGSTIVANATLKIRSVTSISNVTYVMLGHITIPVGKTLTINKGVVIKAPYQSYYRIDVQGALFANGSTDSNIVFTSARDDNAGGPGDTNKDGTLTAPAKGDFGGIVFAPGSLGSSILNYCDVRFAILSYTYYANQYQSNGAITTVSVNPTISNCKISNCNIGVMCYQSSNPVITNVAVTNASLTPVAISMSANPTFTNVTAVNPGYLALGIIGETVTASGFLKKRNLYGYTNITYVLLDNITIANGTNIEIENGIVIKFNNTSIDINGGFRVNGTGASRVTFTSLKDDNIGNPFDTNGDGNASTPASGNWGAIVYESTSDDVYSYMRSVDFKYGGSSYNGTVVWSSAAAAMDDCIIFKGYNYGINLSGNANPVIDSTQIQNCTSDPIGMSLLSDPTFTNITFAANATKGIRIIDNNLSSNAQLKKRSLAGISNIAYFISSLTIASTAVLTIDPGVVIKNNSYGIYVYGAVVANGTNADKVVFTSTRDDANGGDYNNDGNATSPNKNDYQGLIFYSSALNSSMKNCVFKYGSGWYNYDGFLTLSSTNLVTIDSSSIEQSSSAALTIYGSTASVIKNTQIINIDNVPVMMSMFSAPTFTNMSLNNVRDIGLGIIPETYSQNATIPIRNFAGYNNITYVGLGSFTVNAGTTITIPAGITFKGGYWDVNGRLNVQGSVLSPVVFTSIADDAFGNPLDTRQDGNLQLAYNYTNNGWAFNFNDISNDSGYVKNTIIRYYNGGINMTSASSTIDSCTFSFDFNAIRLAGVSQPVLNNCKFNDMTWNNPAYGYRGRAFTTSVLSYPSTTLNNSFSGSNIKGICIINETLSQDVTMVKRNFGGITNIPYVFEGFTVGSGATLTISPGIVCKFFSGSIDVNKGLIAEGGSTADSTIVFTSIYDDFYGGDTNVDSNATNANIYGQNWTGISINNQSLNNLCKFKNVIVKYATYGINTTSKSPTIANSNFRYNGEGIRMTGASNPVISNCDFVNNYYYGVNNVDKSFTVVATNCWWGNNSGPSHSSNPSGTGDKITDAVTYSPFRTIDAQNPIMGDVSLNGQVQAYDAALVMQSAVALITFNAIQNKVGDVSGSTGITAFDASLILQFVVDKIRTFPAEELFKTSIAPASARLEMENAAVKAGESFTIPVRIADVSKAQSLDIQIQFDPSLLELTEATQGTYIQGLSVQQNINKQTGLIIYSIASTEMLAASGDVLWLTFKSKTDLLSNQQTTLSVLRFLANEDDMKQQISGGNITISSSPNTGITSVGTLQAVAPYPNPFRDQITVPYYLRESEPSVSMDVYTYTGQKIFTTVKENVAGGVSAFEWKGVSNSGEPLQSGIYFIHLNTSKQQLILKATLIR